MISFLLLIIIGLIVVNLVFIFHTNELLVELGDLITLARKAKEQDDDKGNKSVTDPDHDL